MTNEEERVADRDRIGALDRDGGGEQEPPRLFAWVASLATILLLITVLLLGRGENDPLRIAGVVLLALSVPFMFVPFFQLPGRGGNVEGESYMQTVAVAERGLYGIVRHPQYLGYMLLACGFALLSQHLLAVVLASVSITAFYVQAVEEEGYCLGRFEETYAQYRRRVPRFNVVLGLVRRLRRGGA